MPGFVYKIRKAVFFLIMDFRWAMEEFRLGGEIRKDSFNFINGNQLPEERHQFLKKNSSWVKKTRHLLIYKQKTDMKETVVVNLSELELYKLREVLSELSVFRPIDYDYCRDGMLACICPNQDVSHIWHKSLLNFYLDNYIELKQECLVGRQFLKMYQYISGHIIGKTVLDVGSADGVFAILLKLKMPGIDITASDYTDEKFYTFALPYCRAQHLDVKFKKLDILSPPVEKKYDTVTTIHMLEHFEEKDTLTVIKNLIHLTNRRLIIAVPFEEYKTQSDHRQKLTVGKFKKMLDPLRVDYKIEQIEGWSQAIVININ